MDGSWLRLLVTCFAGRVTCKSQLYTLIFYSTAVDHKSRCIDFKLNQSHVPARGTDNEMKQFYPVLVGSRV